MERFLKRYEDRIQGSISGFDRLLFRGTLQSICWVGGMDRFLANERVLYKHFGSFAQGISTRIKKHARRIADKLGRPLLYLDSCSQSKEEIAQTIMQRNKIERGLICILSCVEPCQAFDIARDRSTKSLQLVKRQRKCLHLYFYFIDREFGLMHVRLQTWLPLTIQVCLNGRHYLARGLSRAGIAYQQYDNCFTVIADCKRAQRMIDRLQTRNWVAFLDALAGRVNPWLHSKSKPCLGSYYWTIRESEYATDVLFRDAAALKQIYPALTQHAITHFHSENVLRFLGRRFLQANGQLHSDLGRRIEGLRIKHWVQENSIKMYDKAGSVLRIETTINNPRRFSVRRTLPGKRNSRLFPLRRGVADIGRRVSICKAANARYLQALSVIGDARPSHQLLDAVSQPVQLQQRRFRPLHPISPQEAPLFDVLLVGQFLIDGFRNQDLRTRLFPQTCTSSDQARKLSARITRHLALLRAHHLIEKVAATHRYNITQKGYEVITTALKLRQTDLTLLAA